MVPRPLVVVPPVLFLALLLSGCASPGASSTSDPAAADRVRGGPVSGVVVDTLQAPIEGAEVRIRALELFAMSDASGRWRLDVVPEGRWRLEASLHGGLVQSHDLRVVAGRETEVQFMLAPSTSLEVPFTRTNIQGGFLECSADEAPTTCAEAIGSQRDRHQGTFEDAEAATLLVEAAWTPSTPATGTDLVLQVCIPDCGSPVASHQATGGSPLAIRFDAPPSPSSFGSTYEARMSSAAGQVSVAQSFTLYVAVCYLEACAPGYTLLPEE